MRQGLALPRGAQENRAGGRPAPRAADHRRGLLASDSRRPSGRAGQETPWPWSATRSPS